jgi:ech hydrogenase subunit D
MGERKYVNQEYLVIPISGFIGKVRDLLSDGYRLGQICCTKTGDGLELLYSFAKDYGLINLKLLIGEKQEIMSITHVCWAAFIYENEIQDLFGVAFRNSALDYHGHFIKTIKRTPWNPHEEERKDEQNG